MRKGPHPLPMHLGMIAANMAGGESGGLLEGYSLSESDAVEMVRGIQMYQKHPFIQERLPNDIIWSCEDTVVRKPIMDVGDAQRCGSTTPLLLIPSLINKYYILDLNEKKSFARWMRHKGVDVYILDWGNLHAQGDQMDMDKLIETRLCEAIIRVSEIHQKPVDLLGYCMGGLLTLGAYQSVASHVRRMVLLASPFDFFAPHAALPRNVRLYAPLIMPEVKSRGYLPAEWMQTLFASIDPNGSAKKFMDFAKMDQCSKDVELFIAVEDWLNDGVDLPGNIAHHCIQEWFVENKTAKGQWNIKGAHVDLSMVEAEVLVVASKKDQIVNASCAFAVDGHLVNAKVTSINLDCGHISLIVGRRAIDDVWTPIYEWLIKK